MKDTDSRMGRQAEKSAQAEVEQPTYGQAPLEDALEAEPAREMLRVRHPRGL